VSLTGPDARVVAHGATIFVATGADPIHVDVPGTSGSYEVDGATIDPGAGGGRAVYVNAPARVVLRNITVTRAANLGIVIDSCASLRVTGVSVSGTITAISVQACPAVIDRSTFTNNFTGVHLYNYASGVMVIDRCVISKNLTAGLTINAAGFSVTNNFIVENGGPSGGGGVTINAPPDCAPSVGCHELHYNTIAFNQATPGVPSGIGCVNMPPTAPAFFGNIVWNPASANDVDSFCNHRYSDIHATTAGAGNFSADPIFANAAQHQYHLQATSPCRGVGAPPFVSSPELAYDFDGDARPAAGADVGADQFVP
jgi:hypothetical protein